MSWCWVAVGGCCLLFVVIVVVFLLVVNLAGAGVAAKRRGQDLGASFKDKLGAESSRENSIVSNSGALHGDLPEGNFDNDKLVSPKPHHLGDDFGCKSGPACSNVKHLPFGQLAAPLLLVYGNLPFLQQRAERQRQAQQPMIRIPLIGVPGLPTGMFEFVFSP